MSLLYIIYLINEGDIRLKAGDLFDILRLFAHGG